MKSKTDVMDIVGRQFGKLTVADYAGRDKRGVMQYKCECSCGKEAVIVRRDALLSGNTRSCGCIRGEKINVSDIVGKRYGHIVVMDYAGRKGNEKNGAHYYHCHCDCGNDIDISRKTLLSGRISKCGKCGKIIEEGDHYKYVCLNGTEWIFDPEDYEFVCSRQWHVEGDRYPYTNIGQTQKAFHSLVLNPPEGFTVDHIDGNTLNNRRSNLRYASALDNARNKVILPYNTSGYKGVACYHRQKKSRPFRSQIVVDGKSIHLGYL